MVGVQILRIGRIGIFADGNIELAVGPKFQKATVVVGSGAKRVKIE